MDPEEVKELIRQAIYEHEVRVAVLSAAMGTVLLVGTWHAIFLLNNQ